LNRRYQVFISSTYRDLHVERQEIIRALLELDCIPAGMELFPAADDDAWTLIKRVIDESDYYIVISAGRYGSAHPETGTSYTEMEYDYAASIGKPIIAFLHSDLQSLPVEKSDTSEKSKKELLKFRSKMQQKVTKDWTTPDGLAAVVSRSIVQLIKQRPATGWIRADLDDTQELKEKVAELSLKLIENEELITRIRDEKARSSATFASPEIAEQFPLTHNYIGKGLQKLPHEVIRIVMESIGELGRNLAYAKPNELASMIPTPESLSESDLEDILMCLERDKAFRVDGDGDVVLREVYDSVRLMRINERIASSSD